jgi:hypothetical protein
MSPYNMMKRYHRWIKIKVLALVNTVYAEKDRSFSGNREL